MSIPLDSLYESRYTPEAGDTVYPDEWPSGGGKLVYADAFDQEYFGKDGQNVFRIKTYQKLIPTLPVKIEITGRTAQRKWGGYYIRCKITFCMDGEPDVITGGLFPLKWK